MVIIPKGWCVIFRGDVAHCGAEYRNGNDRLHFYLELTGVDIASANSLYSVSQKPTMHQVEGQSGCVYGLHILKRTTWCLVCDPLNANYLQWIKTPSKSHLCYLCENTPWTSIMASNLKEIQLVYHKNTKWN